MRATIVGSLLLCVAPAITAQEPMEIVRVASVELENRGKETVVRASLENNSSKAITAYTLAVLGTYPNGGTISREVTDDLVFTIAFQRLGWPVEAKDRFWAGDRHTVTMPLPLDSSGQTPASAKATVKMAAFSDMTALGSLQDIDALRSSRRNEAAAMSVLIADIETIKRAPQPALALQSLIDTLAKEDAAGGSTPGRSPREALEQMNRHRRIGMLKSVSPLISNPGTIAIALEGYKVRQSVVAEHAAIELRAD